MATETSCVLLVSLDENAQSLFKHELLTLCGEESRPATARRSDRRADRAKNLDRYVLIEDWRGVIAPLIGQIGTNL